MLRVAAREFREHASIDDFELIGTVIRLEREQSTRGMVTLSGFVDSTLRRVKTVLDDENYQMAIQAHSSRELVSCTGELIKAGRSYTLSNPRKFTILDDPFREEDEEALALR